MFRLLATISAFMVVGTVGGVEWGNIGYIDGFIRIISLIGITVIFHSLAEKPKKKKSLKNCNSLSSK